MTSLHSKKFLAASSIMLMVAAVFVVAVAIESEDSDAKVFPGSSESNPLNGLEGTPWLMAGGYDSVYLRVGGYVSMYVTGHQVVQDPNVVKPTSVTSGFGLTFYDNVLYDITSTEKSNIWGAIGYLSKAGTCVLNLSDGSTFTIYSIAAESSVDFTSPDAVSGISGSSFSYQATTNVSATFSKQSSTASFLSITSSGLLTGTLPSVTSKTSYTFTIKATSQSNSSNTATQKVTIDVYPVAKITASPSNTITAKTGDSVNVSLSGNLPMTFAKSSGTWPSGISMTSAGVISGTPSTTSTASVVVKGTTSEGPSQSPTITIKFSISKAEPTLTMTFSISDNAKYLVGNNVQFDAVTNVDLTNITKTSGPSWLSLLFDYQSTGTRASVNGSVPATYTSPTTETITLKAVSPGGQTVSKSVKINIEPVAAFTSAPTASCVITAVYSYDDNGVPTKNSRFIPELDAAVANYTFKDTLTVRGTFTGTDARTVTWDWGDGSADEGFVVDHKYAEPGLYTIKMTASNEVGSDSVEVIVQVGSDDNVILGYVIIGIVVLLLVYILYRVICRKGRCKSRRY